MHKIVKQTIPDDIELPASLSDARLSGSRKRYPGGGLLSKAGLGLFAVVAVASTNAQPAQAQCGNPPPPPPAPSVVPTPPVVTPPAVTPTQTLQPHFQPPTITPSVSPPPNLNPTDVTHNAMPPMGTSPGGLAPGVSSEWKTTAGGADTEVTHVESSDNDEQHKLLEAKYRDVQLELGKLTDELQELQRGHGWLQINEELSREIRARFGAEGDRLYRQSAASLSWSDSDPRRLDLAKAWENHEVQIITFSTSFREAHAKPTDREQKLSAAIAVKEKELAALSEQLSTSRVTFSDNSNGAAGGSGGRTGGSSRISKYMNAAPNDDKQDGGGGGVGSGGAQANSGGGSALDANNLDSGLHASDRETDPVNRGTALYRERNYDGLWDNALGEGAAERDKWSGDPNATTAERNTIDRVRQQAIELAEDIANHSTDPAKAAAAREWLHRKDPEGHPDTSAPSTNMTRSPSTSGGGSTRHMNLAPAKDRTPKAAVGPTITVGPDSTTTQYPNGRTVIEQKDGTTIYRYPDGSQVTDFGNETYEKTPRGDGIVRDNKGLKQVYTPQGDPLIK